MAVVETMFESGWAWAELHTSFVIVVVVAIAWLWSLRVVGKWRYYQGRCLEQENQISWLDTMEQAWREQACSDSNGNSMSKGYWHGKAAGLEVAIAAQDAHIDSLSAAWEQADDELRRILRVMVSASDCPSPQVFSGDDQDPDTDVESD